LPMSTAGGVFAVCQPGEVYLLRSAGSRQKVEPFMPLVRPADSPAWHLAGVQTAGERPLSVVVRGGQLFAMGVYSEPIPHLAALGTAELPAPLKDAPAIADTLVCVVDQAGNLQTYLLPELKPGPAWNPSSKVAWGPRAAGSVFVAATDDGHLHCFDAKQQRPRWKIKLSHVPLVGVCARGEQLFLASQDGMLNRVSLETGDEQGTQDLGEPLGEGLLSAGPAMIVVSAEGSLLKVTTP
jgi:PQQ-like domain